MLKLIIYCSKLISRFSLLGLLFYFFFPNKAFAAVWQKYPNNPIINISLPTFGWDTLHVFSPSVIHTGDTYDMWYQGNGGLGYRIGYAYSDNEISGWVRTSTPVISPGSNDGWEKDVAEPRVLYDSNLNTYKMWFTSLNTDHWSWGKDRFRLRSATNSGDMIWFKEPEWSLTGNDGSWDSGGMYKGKSIIYRDGLYRLWYGGTNETPLGSNAFWRIGYATSTDSAHWKKENLGNPVIEPTAEEPRNASYPTVLYSDGLYHMWYGAGNNDDPTQINYAYSKDGIVWVRPAELNPAIIGIIGSFDQNIAPSTILNENNILKLWYSGLGPDSHWRIGYATASASILPTPDPATVPTAPPLPTATSTPTPTPLPPTKTVIVIPGMTATWNADALVNCKLSNYRGDWTLIEQARQIYDPLVQSLTNNGWVTKLYTYDWRKQIPENEPALKTYIDSQLKTGEKLDIVGHSMGGLLARSYLETEQWNNKVEKLITVGSPHKGSAEAYPTWSAGIIPNNDPAWTFMLTLIKKRCALKTQNDRIAIQQYFPAIQNLLPVLNYLIDNPTGNSVPVDTMNAKNNWLTPSSFVSPFFGVTLGTLSGTDQPTELKYRVDPQSRLDAHLGNWSDGKPVETINTTEGDGTVFTSSSMLDGAENETISSTHTDLVTSQEGISRILTFLGLPHTTLTTQSLQPPSSGLYVIGYPANFWIMDPKGKVSKDTDGLISFSNPEHGSYKVFITPKQKDSLIIFIQVLSNGNVLYKEYTDTNRLPKIRSLDFNGLGAEEDILH